MTAQVAHSRRRRLAGLLASALCLAWVTVAGPAARAADSAAVRVMGPVIRIAGGAVLRVTVSTPCTNNQAAVGNASLYLAQNVGHGVVQNTDYSVDFVTCSNGVSQRVVDLTSNVGGYRPWSTVPALVTLNWDLPGGFFASTTAVPVSSKTLPPVTPVPLLQRTGQNLLLDVTLPGTCSATQPGTSLAAIVAQAGTTVAQEALGFFACAPHLHRLQAVVPSMSGTWLDKPAYVAITGCQPGCPAAWSFVGVVPIEGS